MFKQRKKKIYAEEELRFVHHSVHTLFAGCAVFLHTKKKKNFTSRHTACEWLRTMLYSDSGRCTHHQSNKRSISGKIKIKIEIKKYTYIWKQNRAPRALDWESTETEKKQKSNYCKNIKPLKDLKHTATPSHNTQKKK